jgi:CRP/FNR family transcriptional regulator
MAINTLVENHDKTTNQHTIYGIANFFSEDHLNLLQGIMYPKRAGAKAVLFWEGDKTEKLYFIRSGKVKLRKTTEEGKDLILSILQKGDLLGEIGAYEESFHTYSAEVLEEAELGVLLQKDLEVLLYQRGDFAVEFMKWMGLMQRTTESKFRDLLLFGKPGALASTLIRLSNMYGIATGDGIRLDIRLTNMEIADLIGSTREGVNRMLSTLKDEGIIGMLNGQIVIYHLEKLRRICHCPSCPGCPKEICRI